MQLRLALRWASVCLSLGLASLLPAAAATQGGAGEKQGTPAPAEPEASAWEWLCSKYDTNKDGRIARKEYTRDDEHWGRLDTDRDGWLAKIEFETRKPDKAGATKDGREGASSAPKEGELAPGFALPLLVLPAKAGAQEAGDKPVKSADQKPELVRLADFRNKRPVALIFGSYT